MTRNSWQLSGPSENCSVDSVKASFIHSFISLTSADLSLWHKTIQYQLIKYFLRKQSQDLHWRLWGEKTVDLTTTCISPGCSVGRQRKRREECDGGPQQQGGRARSSPFPPLRCPVGGAAERLASAHFALQQRRKKDVAGWSMRNDLQERQHMFYCLLNGMKGVSLTGLHSSPCSNLPSKAPIVHRKQQSSNLQEVCLVSHSLAKGGDGKENPEELLRLNSVVSFTIVC